MTILRILLKIAHTHGRLMDANNWCKQCAHAVLDIGETNY